MNAAFVLLAPISALVATYLLFRGFRSGSMVDSSQCLMGSAVLGFAAFALEVLAR